MSITATAPAFFLAVVVILLACKVVSWAVSRVGQAPVVGEMITGVLLGPSLLGLLWPASQTDLFPTAIRPLLYVGGQFGLVVFMFQAGYEFAAHRPRGAIRSAGLVSSAGTTVPLVLGIVVSLLLGGWANTFLPNVPLWVSAGFVGVALAITAFPMLARIISERGLAGTRFGSIALACGAIDDVVAWILLAVVVGAAAGSAGPIALAVGGAAVFAALMFTVGRRFLSWTLLRNRITEDQRLLATVIVLFAAAWFTDRVGLYAVFGAFCVGVVLPRGEIADRIIAAVSPVTRLVFLPLFFVYSGLNTKFALLGQPKLLVFTLACVAVAIVGKLGSCWVAARLAGEPPAVAVRVGVLMNARGLMQLIALNVGLQANIVSSRLFTALVVVALVTTVMTTPLLSLVDWREQRSTAPVVPASPAALAGAGVATEGEQT
ncbi:MAG TPA: cation:proton antiporter [Pseudonocardiaceae bacterium]|jgi:Kef-type K+ transport system membrane component KefB|nr:cation:proton antiporter [Pseudonocardiaceae bacterium]